VTTAGALVATDASITGEIVTDTGSIANWDINPNQLSSTVGNTQILFDSSNPSVSMFAEFASTSKETLVIRPDATVPPTLHEYGSGTNSNILLDSLQSGTFSDFGLTSPQTVIGPGKHNVSFTFDISCTSATASDLASITFRIYAKVTGGTYRIIGENVLLGEEFFDASTLILPTSVPVYANIDDYDEYFLWAQALKEDSATATGDVTIQNIAWEETNTTLSINALGIFRRVNSNVVEALGSGAGGGGASTTSGISTVNWGDINNKPFTTLGTGLSVTSDEVSVDLSAFSTTDLSEGTNLYYTESRFDSSFTGKSTTDLSEGTNLYYTDERVDDRVSSLIQDGTNITWTYDDVANTFTPTVSLTGFTTDDISEGSTNLYYTQARFDADFTAKSTTDLSEGTNLYFTNERVDDRVNTLIQDGTGITWTYDDGANTLTPTVSLTGFTTDDISEGSTNLYYTAARVQNEVSGGGTFQTLAQEDDVTFAAATFTGNVIVQGSTIQVDSQISTSDAVIDMNDGETGAGVTLGYSGLNIDRGTSNNYWFGFDEVRNRFTVGQISALDATNIASTQVVATREDSPTANGLPYWDSSNNRFSTSANATLDASGNVDFGGTLDTTGATTLSDTLDVTGATTLSNTLNVTGTTTLSSSLTVSGLTTTQDIIPDTGYTRDIGSLSQKYLTLHAAELAVETLVASDRRVTMGGRFTVGTSSILTAAVGTGDTSISVETNNLNSGDILHLEANGKVEFMEITSAASGTGPYTYSVTRNLDGSGANAWEEGDAVFNTGTTGAGFIDMFATNSLKTGTSTNGPTVTFMERTGTGYNAIDFRGALGNLKGLYNYGSDVYGAAFGDETGTNITIDPTNGIRIKEGASTVLMQLNSDILTIGSNFSYIGSTTTLTVGNWTVNTDTLTGGDVTLDSGGDITVGTSNDVARLSTTDATYRFWIGNSTAGSAPVRVTPGGTLTATDIVATGTINATSGYIGGSTSGWEIASDTISSTGITLTNDATGTTAANASVALGSASALGTGVGVWMDGAGNFRVGDPAGDNME